MFIRLIIVVLDSPACFKEEITFESTVVSYFVTNFVNGTELISVEKSSPDLIILMLISCTDYLSKPLNRQNLTSVSL